MMKKNTKSNPLSPVFVTRRSRRRHEVTRRFFVVLRDIIFYASWYIVKLSFSSVPLREMLLKHIPLDTIFQKCHVKIDQQTDFLLSEFHISQYLSFMYRIKTVYRFQFEH